jgi:hypothetical protein
MTAATRPTRLTSRLRKPPRVHDINLLETRSAWQSEVVKVISNKDGMDKITVWAWVVGRYSDY